MDAGCGTGDIAIFLAQQGFIVDAVDTAADMLMVAKEKTHNLGLKINYTIQDMCSFKSHNKYSLITCINDGVNYLNTLDDVELFLKNANNHMKNNAYLLFDISTEHKLKNMDNQFYAEDDEEFAYIWFNSYDEQNKLLTMELTFFTQVEDDLYNRSIETHIQRAHSVEEITNLLKKYGFKLINTYADISLNEPKNDSERIHFFAQKI